MLVNPKKRPKKLNKIGKCGEANEDAVEQIYASYFFFVFSFYLSYDETVYGMEVQTMVVGDIGEVKVTDRNPPNSSLMVTKRARERKKER